MRLPSRLISVAFGLAAVIVVGCSDSGDDPPTSPNGGGTTDTIVSFAGDIQPIIQAKGCTNGSCHGAATQSGLALGSGTYNDVINASGNNGAFVVPGFADSSNFYLKVAPNPPFGARMPATGSFLTSDQVDMVQRWINQGAQDN